MGFTFQINSDVKFIRNEDFLRKAKENTPRLIEKSYLPVSLVDIVKDGQAMNHFKAQKSLIEIEQLSSLVLKKGDKIVLDFGQHHVGYFKINIQSVGSPMDAPLHLHLTFAETPAEIGIDSSNYQGWISSSWISEERIHLDVLPTTLNLPRRYSFRYVEIEVLDTSPKYGVAFSQPSVKAVSSAKMEHVPVINIDDPLLKQIDEVSIKTLHECMQSVFEDGPKRDRRLWLGDLRLQALANYYTFKQTDIVKRCLYLFAGMACADGRLAANVFIEPQPIPDDTFLYDYSLFFISCLYDYYHFSHDLDTLKDLYPTALKAIEAALSYIDKSGHLLLNDIHAFIDWSEEIDKEAATYAILIYTLKQFIDLAKCLKDTAKADKYHNIVIKLSKTAIDTYFDKEQGLFVSGPHRQINIASQVWFVLSGILPKKENKKIMLTALEVLFPIREIGTPYMYHFIAEALFTVDLKQEGIRLIKDYWGKMIELGADTFWEAFKPDDLSFSPYQSPIINSYCHAWSCTPTYLLRKYVYPQ